MKTKLKEFTKELLEEKIEMIPECGCWIWIGTCDADGYGVICISGKTKRVSRLSWELYNGSIPQKMLVCHQCDIKPCINPYHLFLGTHADNANDFYRKGRSAQLKLTATDIQNIRKDRRPRKEIAEEYKISIHYVSDIRHDGKYLEK